MYFFLKIHLHIFSHLFATNLFMTLTVLDTQDIVTSALLETIGC